MKPRYLIFGEGDARSFVVPADHGKSLFSVNCPRCTRLLDDDMIIGNQTQLGFFKEKRWWVFECRSCGQLSYSVEEIEFGIEISDEVCPIL